MPTACAGEWCDVWALKLFLISSTSFGLLYHYATSGGPHPLPWWPDTFILGGVMGLLTTLITLRFRQDRKAAQHFRNAISMARRRRNR